MSIIKLDFSTDCWWNNWSENETHRLVGICNAYYYNYRSCELTTSFSPTHWYKIVLTVCCISAPNTWGHVIPSVILCTNEQIDNQKTHEFTFHFYIKLPVHLMINISLKNRNWNHKLCIKNCIGRRFLYTRLDFIDLLVIIKTLMNEYILFSLIVKNYLKNCSSAVISTNGFYWDKYIQNYDIISIISFLQRFQYFRIFQNFSKILDSIQNSH